MTVRAATRVRNRIHHFLTGVNKAAAPAICSQIIAGESAPVSILLTINHELAEQWMEDIEFMASSIMNTNQVEARILPDLPSLENDSPALFDSECDRLST